jgi:phosphopantothenoylcysteine decarboxylase/phosphopantothenate--cysteine ligase
MMTSRNIALGVTGGIAAYKAVEIASRLKKEGHHVRVIMTKSAAKFVAPLTFREISGSEVISDMWQEVKTWHVEHIALANWADLFLIAPATANMIGKIASGIADDMLSTTVMATKAQVVIAPAMNNNMYTNPVTQKNIAVLKELGYYLIEPETGRLACGTEAIGRLPEPLVIVQKVKELLFPQNPFKGVKVLVTAGGTREPLDPVRYIGNRSSGKMGYALADAAARRGASVTLISGAVNIKPPPYVTLIKTETALQMKDAVLEHYPNADIVIKAAAVADYRPAEISGQKIKKDGDQITITLVKNPDILKELGEKKDQQILVGFAAETEKLLENAQTKLKNKNLDLVVANDVTAVGAGFDADTNIVKLIYPSGVVEELKQMTKQDLAEIILDKIGKLLQEKRANCPVNNLEQDS